jgi:hypothetical protein
MSWKGDLPKSPEAVELLVKSQSFEHLPTHTSNDFSRNNDVNFRT